MKNPLKISAKTEWFAISLIVLAGISSVIFYSNFPDQVPTHWNIAGEIDQYSGKTFAAFFFPAMILGMYLLFLFLPMFDPKKERYTEFSDIYHIFKNSIIGLLSVIYLIVGLSGMGYKVPVGTLTPVLIGILFMVLGNYMGKLKRNWFMGVRTPWTLSNEENWNKTNRLTGKTFILCGLIFLLEPLMPISWKIPVFIAAIALAVAVPFIYSAWLFLKQK